MYISISSYNTAQDKVPIYLLYCEQISYSPNVSYLLTKHNMNESNSNFINYYNTNKLYIISSL